MSWRGAIDYCAALQGSRLPDREAYFALAQGIVRERELQPNKIADMRGNMFWTSVSKAFRRLSIFDGSTGSAEKEARHNLEFSVRCVRFAL